LLDVTGFEQSAVLVLSGADFDIVVNEEPKPHA
jgi:hypothetical protein